MTDQSYRVLARKYRPTRFSELIGQDVLVRTLTNAFSTNRIAHAFLLTGIRGIGKTTTARIIARALNCIGPDGNGNPTIEPCGVCTHCSMIANDRHVDVLEMDAASRTGVADIRDLIETVRYLPSSARYKVYIIDEVHMLSTSAFNALLKTLEEPPPHVKFIFATTETRKIPVTILSRCQRFDLKRVDIDTLTRHLLEVGQKENVQAQEESIKLIATAAEGSVRDALSLFDQAISHAASEGGIVTAPLVRNMLGLADKSQSFDLLEPLFAGDIKTTLHQFKQLYHDGADPLMTLQDLLELAHFITRIKIIPELADDVTHSEMERARGKALAQKLPMPVLTRFWQMLLKGIGETRMAPNPMAAAEMVLVRTAYASDLPTPADLIRSFKVENKEASIASPAPARNGNQTVQAVAPARTAPELTLVQSAPTAQSYEEVVALFAERKEMVLYSHLKQSCGLVAFEPGRIELYIAAPVGQDFTSRVARLLSEWTGTRWVVANSAKPGAASLAAQQEAARQQQRAQAAQHPLVASALEHFPGATVTQVKAG